MQRWNQRFLVLCGIAIVLAGVVAGLQAGGQQTTAAHRAEANNVVIDADDIGGVVLGAAGP